MAHTYLAPVCQGAITCFFERACSFDFSIGRLSAVRYLLRVPSRLDSAGLNIRFRWNFGEGNDLWLVYDEGFNRFSAAVRTVVVKYTRTVVL